MNIATVTRVPHALKVAGIGYSVLQTVDIEASAEFYTGLLGYAVLGRDMLPECAAHVALRAPSGQMLVLSRAPSALPDLSDTGVHHAFHVGAKERDRIAAALSARQIPVFTYKEDRPAEEADNFYFYDADGHRLQLVSSERPAGVDHVAVLSADVLRGEIFYGGCLGWPVEHRVGWATADYVRARRWAAGEEDMAPGTRRMDKRYSVMVQKKTVPRANMQLFFKAGGSVLGLYLANRHYQETPEEQSVGLPRVAFAMAAGGLEAAAERLASHNMRFVGPVEHPASSPLAESLYVRDPSGNFVEFYVARG